MRFPKLEMNIFQTILARHSVRSYTPDIVDSKTINTLLEAAVRAPTAMHQECLGFVVIQEKVLLRYLSDIAKPLVLKEIRLSASNSTHHHLDIFEQENFNIFYNANTLILICAKTEMPFSEADGWLSSENLMLLATAMGLGSCVVGCALPVFKIDEIKTKLRIPSEFSVIAPIILGYPAVDVAPTPRKAPVILSRFSAG